jgi:hypothetical protein
MSLWFYVTKCTMGCHVYDIFKNQLLPLKTLKKCIFLILTGFERFKGTMSALSVGYILSWDHSQKGGILSETEVTETLCVQSLACLPYIDIEQSLTSFCSPMLVVKWVSSWSLKFAFTIGVTTAITIQQFFCIVCNKCTTSAFETQV